MNLEKLRKHCLSFPGATEQIQWAADLVFRVGGKKYRRLLARRADRAEE